MLHSFMCGLLLPPQWSRQQKKPYQRKPLATEALFSVKNLLKKMRCGKDESGSRGEGGKKKTSTFVNALSSIARGAQQTSEPMIKNQPGATQTTSQGGRSRTQSRKMSQMTTQFIYMRSTFLRLARELDTITQRQTQRNLTSSTKQKGIRLVCFWQLGNENGEMLIDFIENGPFQIKEEINIPGVNGVADVKEAQMVADISPAEKIQYDCDIKETNIILLGLLVEIYTLINNFQTAKQQPELLTQLDYGLVVPSFLPTDDPIASLNKAMMFLSTVINSKSPTTNNQLRTLSNPRTQSTVQDGRVTIQNIQGSEGHIAKQCTSKKRVKDAEWFKEKMLLAQAQEAGVVLPDDQQDLLADRLKEMNDDEGLKLQTTSSFKVEHVDAYDSDCDDEATAYAIFMASLSPAGSINGDTVGPSYDSELLSELPHYDTYHEDVVYNDDVQETKYNDHVIFNDNSCDGITSDNNVISYADYMVTIKNDAAQYVPPPEQDKNTIILSVIEHMKGQVKQCNTINKEAKCVNESLSKTLQELLEQARALKPSDENLDYASVFKRAFATLSGQDIETFTGTMFLNMEQLKKQLDKEEFQEIGSMSTFNVLETQFQMFIASRVYLNDEHVVMIRIYFIQYTQQAIPEFHDTLIQHLESVKKSINERAQHKREYDSWVNERQMQTPEEKVDTSKALDASSVDTESSRTESKEQDTSNSSGNDVHDDGADIRPIYNNEPLAKEREAASAKLHHMIASSNSRISSKNMPRLSSNDMVHKHYLEEAKKKTQERSRNSKPSLMPSARSQSTSNGSKPKPKINNQTSRNWPASKSSCVTTKLVPIKDNSRNFRNFFDSKYFVYSTCQQCVFSANHDSCLTKLLNEVNSRAKVPSNKTPKRNKPIEQISHPKNQERQIPKGHRFSIKKNFIVNEKTMTPRSCLR
uniref:Uncharacterized protein n=1 Tax=Tanacetum cinerariifolium TaxID=118510 RepID=A0A6L2LK81_TANCI|nr:hypothetical protein [Tanacetum cinerariifolium]